MPIEPANPHGYFERGDVQSINDEVLLSRGGVWWAPPQFNDSDWRSLTPDQIGEFRRRVQFIVDDSRDWYLKDPRFCLTLPLWDRLSLATTPVILAVRHPAEVVSSLRVRDGLSRLHALTLWYRYVSGALNDVQDRPVLVVDYGQLIAAPSTAVAPVRQFLESSCSIRLEGGRDGDAYQTITSDLRRHSLRETSGLAWAFWEEAVDLYEALAKLHLDREAQLPGPPPQPSWMSELIDEVANRAEVSRYLQSARAELALLVQDKSQWLLARQDLMSEADALRQQLRSELAEAQSTSQQLQELHKAMEEATSQLESREAEVSRLESLRSALSQELLEVSNERDQIADRIHSLSAQFARDRRLLEVELLAQSERAESLEHQFLQAQAERDRLEKECVALRLESAAVVRERLKLEERLELVASELADAKQVLGDARSRLLEAEETANRAESERLRLESELACAWSATQSTESQLVATSLALSERQVEADRLRSAVAARARVTERLETERKDLVARYEALRSEVRASSVALSLAEFETKQLSDGLQRQAMTTAELEAGLAQLRGSRSLRMARGMRRVLGLGRAH